MITLKEIKFKNLLSVGNTPISIHLNKSDKILISGKNGHGKSLILDAITFALFGKPFRKINKTQLINSINEKELLVEIFFAIGSKNYHVIRGIKPNIFEIYCNNRLIDQTAAVKDYQKYLETHILKLNYKSFTQIVILGSASFVPFMQLPPHDRRAVVEDILDIQIFSKMKEVLKEKNIVVRDDLNEIEHNITVLDSKIEVHENHLVEISNRGEKRKKELKEKIAELKSNLAYFQPKIDEIQEQLELKAHLDNYKTAKTQTLNKLNNFKFQIQGNLKKVEKHLDFIKSNSSCPVCKQNIDEHFKENEVKEHTAKVSQFLIGLEQLNEKHTETSLALSANEEERKRLKKLSEDLSAYLQEIHAANSLINKYQQELEEEHDNDSPDNTNMILTKLHIEKESKLDTKNKLSESRYFNQIIGTLLNDDGIKAKIIEQYLPIINKRMNAYLTDMDAYFNFELDETFSEKICSRYRDEFTYHSFSEGQKKRIDIALLLTWRDIASMKNSVNINLLFLDEVFDSSLDSAGVDDVMKLFDTLKNCNLFVISHRGDLLEEKFTNKINVIMEKKFTVISQE